MILFKKKFCKTCKKNAKNGHVERTGEFVDVERLKEMHTAHKIILQWFGYGCKNDWPARGLWELLGDRRISCIELAPVTVIVKIRGDMKDSLIQQNNGTVKVKRIKN